MKKTVHVSLKCSQNGHNDELCARLAADAVKPAKAFLCGNWSWLDGRFGGRKIFVLEFPEDQESWVLKQVRDHGFEVIPPVCRGSEIITTFTTTDVRGSHRQFVSAAGVAA
jgi:hypothetical protein